jgi:hypothetical protein
VIQTAHTDGHGGEDDEKKDENLHDCKHVAQPNAKAPRESVYKACQGGDANRNASDVGAAWVLDSSREQNTGREADGVSSHVAECYEGYAENACAEKDVASSRARLPIDILQIFQIGARTRHSLLDALNSISRDIEAILEVDMEAGKAVDDAGTPEQERSPRRLGGSHRSLGRIEDAGACIPDIQPVAGTVKVGRLCHLPMVRLITRQITSKYPSRKRSFGAW